ncbi:MAG: DUF711 family protein [Anaerolineales bacterium]|nr:DUF711 family protein [Anaerolineales bacterium]
MNIRTVTCFCEPGFPVSADRLAAAGLAVAEIKQTLQEAGYTVQTTRLAGPPFPEVVPDQPDKVVAYAQALEDMCFVHGLDYATLGPARPADAPEFFRAIPEALGATENVFAAAVMAEAGLGVSVAAVRLIADVIQRCAELTPDGFGNLRFAALANVPAGVPFLPAAYHAGGPAAVALGLEAADLAVTACAGAATLDEARAALVSQLEAEGQKLSGLVKKAAGRHGLLFGGLDFSFAPFPEVARSLGTALENLTGVRVGEPGTLAAAAFLAEAIDRAQFKRAGFCGLFLPVLEDAVLAARAAEGLLAVNDLLLYSAVCGTGLDTLPLPGDTSAETLAAILLDVAVLALRLDKPLTARLMPLPGKRAGDEAQFDFAFFAPSRVLAVRSPAGLGGLMGGAVGFDLNPRAAARA